MTIAERGPTAAREIEVITAAPGVRDYAEVRFSVSGEGTIPVTHAYPLFSALAQVVPSWHGDDAVLVSDVQRTEDTREARRRGKLWLTKDSYVGVRLPRIRLGEIAPLSERELRVGGTTIKLGCPTIRALPVADALYARMVCFATTKRIGRCLPTHSAGKRDHFAVALGRQLERRGLSYGLQVEILEPAEIKIKSYVTRGWGVRLEGLEPHEAVSLLAGGLGGRRHYGGGWFVPVGGARC